AKSLLASATILARWSTGFDSRGLQCNQKKREAVRASLVFRGLDQAREALACSAIFVKAALSCTARSASTLRSMSIDALERPLMNVLYVIPSSRTAALMRAIHSERNSRFFCRRSRYWYWTGFLTASFAVR